VGFYGAPEGVPGNYKTRKCRHFDSGKCKLGGLCNFAHGDEELLEFRPQDSVRTDTLAPVGKIANFSLCSTNTKLIILEKRIEDFYEYQKKTIEQLKFLTLSLQAPQKADSEEVVSLIESNVIRLYNDAVSYVHTINKVMEVGAPEEKESLGDLLTEKTPSSHIDSDASDLRDAPVPDFHTQKQDELCPTLLIAKMRFILRKLRNLHQEDSSGRRDRYEIIFGKAENQLSAGRVLEAAQLLQLVIYDQQLEETTLRMHRSIVEDAKRAFALKNCVYN
jgi:hypothetical protein